MALVVPENSNSKSLCRIAALGKWSPKSHLFGVKPWAETIMLNEALFSCCGGSGIDVTDLATRWARMCGLKSRWARMSRLARDFFDQGRTLSFSTAIGLKMSDGDIVAQKALAGCVRWHELQLRALCEGSRGRLVRDSADTGSGVTDVWAVAAMLIWHYDLLPIVHVHGASPPRLSDWQNEMAGRDGQRSILIVDQVANLWDVARAAELEQVIQFASSFDVPLWLVTAHDKHSNEDDDSKQVGGAGARRFSSGLGKRLRQHRHGPIEQWLSGQALSRLRSVCELPTKRLERGSQAIPEIV